MINASQNKHSRGGERNVERPSRSGVSRDRDQPGWGGAGGAWTDDYDAISNEFTAGVLKLGKGEFLGWTDSTFDSMKDGKIFNTVVVEAVAELINDRQGKVWQEGDKKMLVGGNRLMQLLVRTGQNELTPNEVAVERRWRTATVSLWCSEWQWTAYVSSVL